MTWRRFLRCIALHGPATCLIHAVGVTKSDTLAYNAAPERSFYQDLLCETKHVLRCCWVCKGAVYQSILLQAEAYGD